MGKLKCNCGYVIGDDQVDLPYKGALVPNGAFLDYVTKIQEGISSLLEAEKQGLLKEWITKHNSQCPVDTSNQQMIAEIFGTHYFDLRRLIYQCENCNRIWIQREGSLSFEPFLPEHETAKDILFKAKEFE